MEWIQHCTVRAGDESARKRAQSEHPSCSLALQKAPNAIRSILRMLAADPSALNPGPTRPPAAGFGTAIASRTLVPKEHRHKHRHRTVVATWDLPELTVCSVVSGVRMEKLVPAELLDILPILDPTLIITLVTTRPERWLRLRRCWLCTQTGEGLVQWRRTHVREANRRLAVPAGRRLEARYMNNTNWPPSPLRSALLARAGDVAVAMSSMIGEEGAERLLMQDLIPIPAWRAFLCKSRSPQQASAASQIYTASHSSLASLAASQTSRPPCHASRPVAGAGR